MGSVTSNTERTTDPPVIRAASSREGSIFSKAGKVTKKIVAVGSLERGKDADIAVWEGDPLDARSKVVKTFVNGDEVYARA
ncbi:MAG: hypothetical protein LBL05_01480 [Synergistaceae bacterium]|nr:hypothetical protein [Synergistaceae bacterium]